MTEHEAGDNGLGEADPLVRFRNWLGFFVATVAVNLLFVWGMVGNSGDAGLALWYKALIWLPFNVIATLLYYVFKVKLAGHRGGPVYGVLCLVMIAVNWAVMFYI